MARDPVNFGVWYDFRNPANWRVPFEQLYRENLEQIVAAEALGFDSVWLTEHHFQQDGYSPSPLVIAGAIGAVTKSLRIGTNLVLLPLYNPVRLAEDAATLSLLCGGRFDLGVGAGFVEQEYQIFGRRLQNRPSLMEEGIAIIRQAWSGKPLDFEGKRFKVKNVQVTPSPENLPRLLMGAVSEPAIERCARLGDGFLVSGGVGQDLYLEKLQQSGKSQDQAAIYSGSWGIVSDDPDRARAELGPHLLYQMQSYLAMGAFDSDGAAPTFNEPEDAISQGFYQFWTPDEAVDNILSQLRESPAVKDMHFWARFPGETHTSAQRRLELLAGRVLPRVREALANME